jgi:hypothetical protein
MRRQRGRQAAPCGHKSTVGQRFLRLVPGDDLEERRSPLHFESIAHPGACGKTWVVPHNRRPGPESTEWGTRGAGVVVDL